MSDTAAAPGHGDEAAMVARVVDAARRVAEPELRTWTNQRGLCFTRTLSALLLLGVRELDTMPEELDERVRTTLELGRRQVGSEPELLAVASGLLSGPAYWMRGVALRLRHGHPDAAELDAHVAASLAERSDSGQCRPRESHDRLLRAVRAGAA